METKQTFIPVTEIKKEKGSAIIADISDLNKNAHFLPAIGLSTARLAVENAVSEIKVYNKSSKKTNLSEMLGKRLTKMKRKF
uniref:Uncharacterized protein n=1 Tax=Meloidogyne enterolobii TaxID=390850 RepID=A0A6V7W8Z1_MELEN|nr:unnamed protein product [Meloidogyne enterolobii]